MRILHVIDTLGVGGAEQMLVNLLPSLVDDGHDVAVGVLRYPMTLQPALEARGVRVEKLSDPGSKWNVIRGAGSVANLVRAENFDVVNSHLLFPSIYTGFARLLKNIPAKTFVTYHNLAYAPGCNKPGPGLALRKWVE